MPPSQLAPSLVEGIPLFLDQLAETLRLDAKTNEQVGISAAQHGANLLLHGYTIEQVVRDYGDVCQTITELAIERAFTLATSEFRALNYCLDEAIAKAVAAYGREQSATIGADRATRELGFLAHELRNQLATATLAYEVLRGGTVGIGGSTGAVLGRTLTSLSHLIDRSIATVRLDAGIDVRTPVVIDELAREVELATLLEAKLRGHRVVIEIADGGAVVVADRELLMSAVGNLVENALEHTHPHGAVTIRTLRAGDRASIEVEDECGGLPPGTAEAMFAPHESHDTDRSRLGLAICRRGVDAIGGRLSVRDLPGKGCVFAIDLPVAT